MIVPGPNSGHDSSAALTIDGQLAAYCKDERLIRIQQDSAQLLRQAEIDDVLQIARLPCSVNTSFNAHEEPIINTRREAVVALMEKRIDFSVCDAGLVMARS